MFVLVESWRLVDMLLEVNSQVIPPSIMGYLIKNNLKTKTNQVCKCAVVVLVVVAVDVFYCHYLQNRASLET